MIKRKQTREEGKQNRDCPKPEEPSRPLEKKDLEALLEHFGQTKNLPK